MSQRIWRFHFVGKLVLFAALLWVCLSIPAHTQSPPTRPVVVVPGILGSKLCNGQSVVWGGAASLGNFSRLDLAGPDHEPLTPCGLLDKISILGPFWKIDAYEGLIATLKRLGYRERETLFVFTYDWRRSNIESAQALSGFIAEIGAPKVDIIAHSMGGLVSLIYLHNYLGVHHINKIVFLGTPFLGSMNAFATLSDGWGGAQNMIAGGIDAIRMTALSLPAIYELLPRYKDCCRIGTQNNYVPVDPFDPNSWRQNGWLPVEYSTGSRAAYFNARLARAREVRDIMAKPFPTSVGSVKVVGDAFGTNLYLLMPQSDPSWKKWKFVKARGDETVPAWSAANNTISLEGTIPSFSVHATIFNDHTVQNILERELMDLMIPRETRLRALPTVSGDLKGFDFIDISLEPNTVPVGDKAKLFVSIQWGAPIKRGEFSPHATLKGPRSDMEFRFVETTAADDLAANKLTFAGEADAPGEPGQWRIIFDFGLFDGDYTTVLTTFSR